MVRAIGLTSVGLAALFAGTSASAQTTVPAALPATVSTDPVRSTTQTTTYDAAYFAQFGPRTALDIAQHVPGFTLDLGNSQSTTGVDVRGFAGTAGNVVFNGARPSTKAEALDVTLQRIPAQQVVRVEVGPGDLFGSDYAGKSQVLNIILSQKAGIDGNVTAAAAATLHRLHQPRHLRLGVHPSRPVDDQPLRRNGQQQAIRGRVRHSDGPGDGRPPRIPAQAQHLLQQAIRISPRAGLSSAVRTTRFASTRAGSRAASTCSRATASARRSVRSTTIICSSIIATR